MQGVPSENLQKNPTSPGIMRMTATKLDQR